MARIAVDSREARDLETGVSYYANSATFQALVGVSSAAAAKMHIIEAWGGHQANPEVAGPNKAVAADDDMTVMDLPCTHAYVGYGPWEPSQSAWRTIWQTGLLQTALYIHGQGYAAPDMHRYILNQAGKIRAEIQERIGTVGYHAHGVAGMVDVMIPRPKEFWHGYGIARINIAWES